MKDELIAGTLRVLLEYSQVTGVFTWRHRPLEYFSSSRSCNVWNSKYSGREAGSVWVGPRTGMRYRQISVFNKRYIAHRLAFLWMTGAWPLHGVDHKDRNGLNNSWSNLRQANQFQNMRNRIGNRNSVTGVKGVTYDKLTGKYVAQISVNNRNIFLGRHKTINGAHDAYVLAANKHFQEFARP